MREPLAKGCEPCAKKASDNTNGQSGMIGKPRPRKKIPKGLRKNAGVRKTP